MLDDALAAHRAAVGFTPEETATILAALRYYQVHDQGDPDYRDEHTHDIATENGNLTSLDGQGIDALYDKIIGS